MINKNRVNKIKLIKKINVNLNNNKVLFKKTKIQI